MPIIATADVRNISLDERAVSYGVVNPPQLVRPGEVVVIHAWALPAYEVQPTIWEVVPIVTEEVPIEIEEPAEEAGEGGDTLGR